MDIIEGNTKPALEALGEHQLASHSGHDQFLGAVRQNTIKNSQLNRRSSLISSQANQ